MKVPDKLTCYLKECKVEVKEYGKFCCKEHKLKFWNEQGGKVKRRLTVKQMQKEIIGWKPRKYIPSVVFKKQKRIDEIAQELFAKEDVPQSSK